MNPRCEDQSASVLPVPRAARAMLAICSDLDQTPDAETYFEIMRFLNTTEETRMGDGVGLEVGNSIYFDMPPGHFSYWNATEANRERIRALIRSGHIDCLHSYGDLATTRAHAGRALEELTRHDCQFEVWVDHAQAATNLGSDIMRGHGDDRTHPAYHSDLTIGYGIKYFWRGRVSSIIGQDRGFSLRGIAEWSHPVVSAKTLLKETTKQILARMANRKYALHARNRLLGAARLRDGRVVSEFIRCNPFWGGVSSQDRGDGVSKVITPRYLDLLVERGGYSILYTHLGKLDRGATSDRFDDSAVAAFRMLARYHNAGKIIVTTTARLLRHAAAYKSGGSIANPIDQPSPLPPFAPLVFPNI